MQIVSCSCRKLTAHRKQPFCLGLNSSPESSGLCHALEWVELAAFSTHRDVTSSYYVQWVNRMNWIDLVRENLRRSNFSLIVVF